MNADKLYHMKCRAIAYAPAVPPRVRFGSMLLKKSTTCHRRATIESWALTS